MAKSIWETVTGITLLQTESEKHKRGETFKLFTFTVYRLGIIINKTPSLRTRGLLNLPLFLMFCWPWILIYPCASCFFLYLFTLLFFIQLLLGDHQGNYSCTTLDITAGFTLVSYTCLLFGTLITTYEQWKPYIVEGHKWIYVCTFYTHCLIWV
jgi:hypothetical protein